MEQEVVGVFELLNMFGEIVAGLVVFCFCVSGLSRIAQNSMMLAILTGILLFIYC